MTFMSSSAGWESSKENGQGYASLTWDYDDPFDFGQSMFAMDQPFHLPGPATQSLPQEAKGQASGSSRTTTFPQPQTQSLPSDTTSDSDSSTLSFPDFDQSASTSLDSIFDFLPGLDSVGTDLGLDMGLQPAGKGFDLEFDALNAQMGNILDELSFGIGPGQMDDMGMGITFPELLESSDISSRWGSSIDPSNLFQPPTGGSDLLAVEHAEIGHAVPLAGDNGQPPQNGLIAFPTRDEHLLFPLPSSPSTTTTATTHASSTASSTGTLWSSSPSSSSSFLASPLASSASETPNPKLIWPIPVDKNGVPNTAVLRALGLPKHKHLPSSSGYLSKARNEHNLTDAELQDLSGFLHPSVGAHSPYSDVSGNGAPTVGPTTLTLSPRAAAGKAPDAAGQGSVDASSSSTSKSTSNSGSTNDVHATRIGDESWRISTAPAPLPEVTEALARQMRERRVPRSSRKRPRPTPYDAVLAQSSKGKEKEARPEQEYNFQRMEVVRSREKVRLVPEKPAWSKPVKPWQATPEWLEATAISAQKSKIGFGGKEGSRLFVRLREPDFSRASYGWAIAQIHDPFTSKYLILSGPHVLAVRTVRPYDRLPLTKENFDGLRSGKLKKKDELFYPDVSNDHAAVADHIERRANATPP